MAVSCVLAEAHSLVTEYLISFLVLSIRKKAIMNIQVKVLGRHVFSEAEVLGYIIFYL